MSKTALNLLYYFIFITLTSLVGVIVYKQVRPPETVNRIKLDYQVVAQCDIGRLTNGDNVKFGNINMCVSSIQSSNLKGESDPKQAPVQINLRKAGDCL